MNDIEKRIIANLNNEQKEAVLHQNGPLLIYAGAGSGKTRTLTHRIAYLVFIREVPPERILAVTFTNKSADEMKERVLKMTGNNLAFPWLGTFHSIGLKILKHHSKYIGYQSNFVVYDDGDSVSLIKNLIKDGKLRGESPHKILGYINKIKNNGIYNPSDASIDKNIPEYKIYLKYCEELIKSCAMDYGDLLCKVLELFDKNPSIENYYQRNFQHILVDEFQDTNLAQYLILKKLSRVHQNICVVGDDDQSIYSWRGANIENILGFEKDFQGTKVVVLTRNYRSHKIILDAASDVICNNIKRKQKRLITHREGGGKIEVYRASDDLKESEIISSIIARKIKIFKDIAVFYRVNAQSRLIEEALIKNRIPYIIVGNIEFYRRSEIKDILSYFRLILNPNDSVSFVRIINKPPRGIGEKGIEFIRKRAEEEGKSLYEITKILSEEYNTPIGKKLKPFIELIEKLKINVDEYPPHKFAEMVLRETQILERLKREGTYESKERCENIEELLRAIYEYEKSNETPSLRGFIENVTLVKEREGEGNPFPRKVNLMTVHSAKGLEFSLVIVAGVSEGIFPHYNSLFDPDEIEEERRLMYVAMTRAKDHLILTYPARKEFGYGAKYLEPSRFLYEISSKYVMKKDMCEI